MLNWLLGRRKVTEPVDPTDILVGIICARIISHPRTTWDMFVQGYYDSYQWDWPDKNLILTFNTASYAWDAPPATIHCLSCDGEIISLIESHKQRLVKALTEAHNFVDAQQRLRADRDRQLRAVDAIERIMQ